ncbi:MULTISPECIES: N-acetylmuramoyl-L-alanine amidase [Anaerosinus]|uniref:N-acetylmuramoyl-L-alanine amidase n=1 Tax=Selenobaculum gibii TaxID=3054208 RepID=A0A9Y2AG28_9FIRM|nr:N-acetylmuramoyl-L-alanine amidase [Selenobaculum gbiensis]WIW70164.1 N-acetylmuramoyl-L-alanine amidase [Selenobaculum gbiensis]
MRRFMIMCMVMIYSLLSFTTISYAADFKDRVSGLAKVDGVRVYTNGDSKVRVVLDTTKEVEYRTFVLSNPTRIAIDIKGAWLSPNVSKATPVNSGLVGKVRASQFDPTTVRIVVEANVSKDRYRVFSLKADSANDKMPRIVMDFGDLAQEEVGKTPQEETISTPLPEVKMRTIQLFDKPGLKDKIIAVDPGHGGSDGGAIGPTGITEKEVTLAVGLELKKMLEAEGAKVVMTRTTDVDVARPNASAREELQARVDIANKANATVFVSIHMDAFVNQEAQGTSTYIYQKTNGDERLGRFVREGLINQLNTQDRKTRDCNFYVVKYTTMPATLAEVAFISNPNEERLLKSSDGVRKAAKGIFDGLNKYFSYDK